MIVDKAILLPAVALILWSILMLFWTAALRFPAMRKLRAARAEAGKANAPMVGGRGQDLEGKVEPRIMWPSHNYTHLMEQPTLFYPTILILALTAPPQPLNHGLAWGYVGFRIAHSLWQTLVNRIFPERLLLFFAATFCLLALALHALIGLIH